MTLPISVRIQLGTQPVQPPPSSYLYRVLTDYELGRTSRPRLPMVFFWREEIIPLSREWQWYLVACNYGMLLNNVAYLLKNGVAFCNEMGLYDSSDPRQNWITNEDLDAPRLPAYSRCFTCGDAIAEIKGGIVTSFDGTKPPPLKPGYSWPMTREQATNLDVYLYNPKDHPYMFFAATTTGTDFNAHPFPGGATYPWYKDGQTPVSWMFHIARSPIPWPPAKVADNTAHVEKL